MWGLNIQRSSLGLSTSRNRNSRLGLSLSFFKFNFFGPSQAKQKLDQKIEARPELSTRTLLSRLDFLFFFHESTGMLPLKESCCCLLASSFFFVGSRTTQVDSCSTRHPKMGIDPSLKPGRLELFPWLDWRANLSSLVKSLPLSLVFSFLKLLFNHPNNY